MLIGRRPFGHDQTQERILREDTIIKARKVEFPSRPAVSNEAKVGSFYLFIAAAFRYWSMHYHLLLSFVCEFFPPKVDELDGYTEDKN